MKRLIQIKTKKANKRLVKPLEAFGLKTKKPIIREFSDGKFCFKVRTFKSGFRKLLKLPN